MMRIDIGGEQLDCSFEDGQVRVHLPFAVDLDRLTGMLRRDHYPVAGEPGETDSQGWGYEIDVEEYYPYWVYPDPERPGRSVLAFSPRDYARAGGTHLPRLGEQTRREVRRWYDYLQAAARDPRPH